MLTIVVAFRNRDTERIMRCLDSLAAQTYEDFELLFVDYGSFSNIASSARKVVGQYPFARYLYSDARGWPWNRSRALNIGGKRARGAYVVTTDVDMVFEKDFMAVVARHARKDRVLHCQPYFLPKDYDQWDNLSQHTRGLQQATKDAFGGFMCVATEVFHEIRGFDEYYRFWGREDRDIFYRLSGLGLEVVWLPDLALMFHQWHREFNFHTPGFMPDNVWGDMCQHIYEKRNCAVRNPGAWGVIHPTEARKAFEFIEPESSEIIRNDRLMMKDLPPDSCASIGELLLDFSELPPGHAFGVNHAFYPKRDYVMEMVISCVNRVARKINMNSAVDYRKNILHSYLAECLDQYPDMISDYYLNYPVLNGLTIMVRA
jgi:glycosyltransferase involved in cell wall biosynthesis